MSISIHLSFNSVFCASKATNDYEIVVAQESFTTEHPDE